MSTVQNVGGGISWAMDFLRSLLEAYEKIDISVRSYLLYVLLPAFLFFVFTVAGAFVLPFSALVRLPIPMLGLLVFGSAVIYPKLYFNSRKVAIENQLHLVMTHMTILSTTNIDRIEVFRTLAAEEEYGALAEEMGRVVHIVDTWNQSLDDACRRRAKEVPSPALSDFFDRLGYTIGAGQGLQEFLLSEQSVMLKNYVTIYEGALANLEVMKELYMSMILSMTFALVFAVVLPILTGTDPTLTVSGVILMFICVQLGFYITIRSMAPFDPVWYYPDDDWGADLELWLAVAVGTGGTFLLIGLTAAGIVGYGPGLPGLLWFLDDVPLPLYVSVPVTPMLVTGVAMRRVENTILARDGDFPSFIRALGAAESAKQSTTSAVLMTLREKDFGALSPDINRLYRRLNMRLSQTGAWRVFAADTRSYLIQKFSEMYVVGRQMGGNPKQLGELISKNMNTVNQLREQRRQATVTLIGLLYGITAASVFAFFIGLEVVAILTDISQQFNLESNQFSFGSIIHTGVYDMDLIEFLLLVVVLFNAALSSLMVRTIDGGNKANSYIHFVLLTWIGCLTAMLTRYLVSNLLAV